MIFSSLFFVDEYTAICCIQVSRSVFCFGLSVCVGTLGQSQTGPTCRVDSPTAVCRF